MISDINCLFKQVKEALEKQDVVGARQIYLIKNLLIKIIKVFGGGGGNDLEKDGDNNNIDYFYMLSNKDYLENIYFVKLLERLADLYVECEFYNDALNILKLLVHSYE